MKPPGHVLQSISIDIVVVILLVVRQEGEEINRRRQLSPERLTERLIICAEGSKDEDVDC